MYGNRDDEVCICMRFICKIEFLRVIRLVKGWR